MREEDIEISRIYGICGLLPPGRPLLSERPFGSPSPHHPTARALAGGVALPRPGGTVPGFREAYFFGRAAPFWPLSGEALRQTTRRTSGKSQ
ncbi:MAG: hypothetical protein ACLR0U_01420 [Enterocloster clostridioformis]